MSSRTFIICLVVASFAIPMPARADLSPLDALAQSDVASSTLIGAGVGAAVGAAAGRLIDDNPEKGAIVGTIIGTVIGFKFGSVAKKRRKQFDSESAYLDAEIAAAEGAVSAKEAQLETLEKDISALETEAAELERRRSSGEDVSKVATARLVEIRAMLSKNQELAEQYKSTLKYLDDQLKRSAKKSDRSTSPEELEARRKKLADEKIKLQVQYAKLNGLNDKTRIVEKQYEGMSTD